MKKIVLLIAAFVAVTSLDAQNLIVLHLNDTHSHIDPERTGENKGLGGVIEQAAYIDSVRKADGKKNVLLLHAGDFSQGTSYFTELGGNMEIDVLNAMGCDAVSLGNHEFDNGIDALAGRLKNLKAHVLCANYDFSATPLNKYVKPYVIVKKGGLKIGLIGLLPDLADVVDAKIAAQLKFQDPITSTQRYADYLKNEKGCDLVVVVSHLGYDGPFNTDEALAKGSRNIDVIVGGHSHTKLNEKSVYTDLDGKEVVVVTDWKWGLRVGRLNITK